MRFVAIEKPNEVVTQMEQVYGQFHIGLDGLPTPNWQSRNLRFLRFPDLMQHAYFPEIWIRKVRVNGRIIGPLSQVFAEIIVRWTPEARQAYGLRQFVKCFCFGDGSGPNLFWWGGAWEISPSVTGETLNDVIQIFTRHGFKHDRKKLRTFEYW